MYKKPKMLIVEDQELERIILYHIFREEYEIHQAKDAMEAIEFVQANMDLDIILLDIVMPQIDGFELLRRLKKHSKLKHIPVVVNTCIGEAMNEVKALEMGAADFISKPYEPLVVKQRVNHIVERESFQRLYQQSEIDSLTGIYCKEAFFRKTEEMLYKNPKANYVILYFDVDHFKVINDIYGQETGNKILVKLGENFKKAVQKIGTFGRLDNDHFACCIPKRAYNINHISKKIEEGVKELNPEYEMMIHYGIYYIDDKTLPIDQMCDRAKLALGKVKGNYLNQYCIFDDTMRDQLLERQAMVSEMKHALKNQQFQIYCQPIYCMETGKIVSAEVLVRWEHPVRGMISPGSFIPLFEQNGFIHELDRYVRNQVCQYLQEAMEMNEKTVPVSLNLSRVELYNKNLVNEMNQLLNKYSIRPEQLKLEITESAYMDNPEQLLRVVHGLKENGFQILMDDFGSGFSSLNMLKDLPVDILKIDMKFLEGLEYSERVRGLLSSIIHMSKQMNMNVVCEGVETAQQVEFLSTHGCDSVQGFYYSKPLPLVKFRELMKKS